MLSILLHLEIDMKAKMFKIIAKPVVFVLCYVAFLACGDLDGPGGSVSGTVLNEDFSQLSGSGDKSGSSYTITIADTPEFSCGSISSTPSSYLLITIDNIADIEEQQVFPAAGTVFFNKWVDDASDGSIAATGGTVTIDSIDEFNITGHVSATEPESDISGEFSVEICN